MYYIRFFYRHLLYLFYLYTALCRKSEYSAFFVGYNLRIDRDIFCDQVTGEGVEL